MKLKSLSAASAALLLSACVGLPSTDVDRQLGEDAARTVQRDIGLVNDKALTAYVDSVGQRVVLTTPQRKFNYEFAVVDQVEPNAFAVPGGHIYISRGLLALMGSEDELAGVFAHEVQHVERRHSVKQMKREMRLGLLALPGELVGGIVSDDLAVLAGKPFEAVAAGYSRDQERESDTLGQPVAAAAGYDPLAMGAILDRMEHFIELGTQEKREPNFFDSHPTTPERVATLSKRAAALTQSNTPPIAASNADYLRRLEGLLMGPNPADGVVQDNRFLHPTLGFKLVFPKDWELDHSRKAVVAMAPSKQAVVAFGVAGAGSAEDLPKIADVFVDKLARKYRTQPTQVSGTTAAGFPARAVVVSDPKGKEPTHLYVLWVAMQGEIYQMIGVGTEANRAQLRGIVDSLQPLSKAERSSITEVRLHIVAARAGETPAQVAKRVGGTQASALLAALNGVDERTKLKEGALLKVPVRAAMRAGD